MLHPSYTDLIEAVNSDVEPGEQPVVQSRYSIVIAASKRARQLIAGDKPLVAGAAGKKPLSTAVQELYEQKVKILTEDEEPEIETDFEVKERTPEEIKKEFKKDFRKDRKEFVGHKERKEYKEHKEYKKDSKKDFKKEPKKEFVKENKTETASAVTAAPVYEEKKELHVAVVTEATQNICEKFLQEVLQAMGMGEVTIVSSIDEEGALAIEMSGDNMGILIGKRGQTLDSLQYLTNRVANKSQDGYVRVKLDTEDYRKRRKQTPENLAKNIAYKVKRSRKPISLEPMNPYERRIIHSALQADDRVSTHSEGEEPYRRVVVTPNRR